ncbi:MAG: bifunctional [glutamate--ammonia ligase]-adenylyl-L-tyrosine phosphorylase/[glutamate--ammonia-ligase] adenylyltransferase [Gammaproteobacteria bacterium]|nr:bifunctional [glutamate--ammonia ligase]-adenylyl-L-tyrosine phosphorylase/[glutamate--ammonia-ligase] adenylyltransferase [Gammaproteobacteria bacterium]
MSRQALSKDLQTKGARALARSGLQIRDAATREAAVRAFALSDFLATAALRHQDWLQFVLDDHAFSRPLGSADLARALSEACIQVDAMPALQRALRVVRQRHQLWIVWRHLLQEAELAETTAVCSLMADKLIDTALTQVYAWLCEKRGMPRGTSEGTQQAMVVLALGKLGADELNLSSDVDLLFAYPESGSTDTGETNQQFFVRLGQQLIEALDPTTEDGFVYRVDMRLRPYGDSGPLAMEFTAIEDYYATQGRDWERYALIKARPCAGDVAAGERLLAVLQPFVYRRYLDFGAIDALREMKSRLVAERQHIDDVKLGPGGIRDVEFAVQMQQLIWGGRERALQNSRLLEVVPALVALGLLAQDTAGTLLAGYHFLRNVEHSLQAEADRQTQQLPAGAESRERLAISRGYSDYEEFFIALTLQRNRIASVFDDLLITTPVADSPSQRIWNSRVDEGALAQFGFHDLSATTEVLMTLHKARDRPSVSADAATRLDRLMPVLLDKIQNMPDPDLSLQRVAPILRGVLRRSAYLSLLLENPATCSHFVELTTTSLWLAQTLASHPAFFDSLIDGRILSGNQDRAALAVALEQQLAGAVDFENTLDILREFKAHHVFNIALAEIRGLLPLKKVSDALTFLAEAMVQAAMNLAWQENLERFPQFANTRPFLVVGYGKLGGIELGPGSDLDLVFIHDMSSDANQFLLRLVRRLLHILTVPTYHGALYEIDTRLRPSGSKGMMVSSLESFRDYQLNRAWVWEHQALVRARVVCGDPQLAEGFARIRAEILGISRDRNSLRTEIVGMRQRIGGHHSADDDIKRGSGGIVDIEFMVQYLVLAWADQYPALIEYTDNVRILEVVDRLELLPAGAAARLTTAYLALRAEWHRSVLDIPDQARSAEVLNQYQDDVRAVWQLIFREEE